MKTAVQYWFSRMASLLAIFWVLSSLSLCLSADVLPPIVVNTNHERAGKLRNEVLTLHLQIAKGEWHPEADDGVALPVYAFGEVGHALQNPGPLIRVSQGTEVRVDLHNTLAVPITVHGLGDPNGDTSVHIGPGAKEHVVFTPTTPGVYFYWGAAEAETLLLRYGIDSELSGAFVVDPAGIETNDDEIFVIELMSERPGLGARQTLATINGRSWPYTQRFQYDVGRPVHWRWINATNERHALHLHGFYFRVDAFNRGGRVERYDGESRPTVVTQRISQGETFDMSWSPERSGRWLFHCHMFQHMIPAIVPNVPGLSVKETIADQHGHPTMHDESAMGQLILGITVPETAKTEPKPKPEWHVDRKLQLEISERDSAPRYALRLRDENQPAAVPSPPGLIGPPIVLVRGQPVEIEVMNKLKDSTAIHWHGLEVESFYDGVPGWSGAYGQITPTIAPGTSFVARMNPPRAGTFIYHTHWHDQFQLTNGVYGPLIVLPPGERFDPTSDLIYVFSTGNFGELHEIVLINGTPQSKTLQLQAGKKYRFRFINISTNNVAMQVAIRNTSGLVEWSNIAKDGADLSPSAIRPTKAQQAITVGETYDMEFSSPTAQELQLELLLPGQKIHIAQTLLFAPQAKTTP